MPPSRIRNARRRHCERAFLGRLGWPTIGKKMGGLAVIGREE